MNAANSSPKRSAPRPVWKYGEAGIQGDYVYGFLERFRDAYRAEVQAFVDAVRAGKVPTPGVGGRARASASSVGSDKEPERKAPG